jgi:hypothetical protein
MPVKQIVISVGDGQGFIGLKFSQAADRKWLCIMDAETMSDLQKGYDIPAGSRVEVVDVE